MGGGGEDPAIGRRRAQERRAELYGGPLRPYFICQTCDFRGYESQQWVEEHIPICAQARRVRDLAAARRREAQQRARQSIKRSKQRKIPKAEAEERKMRSKAGARKKKGNKSSRGKLSNASRYP